MKITLEKTAELRFYLGVECRLWQGETDSGIRIYALIPLIAVPATSRQDEFQRELQERPNQLPDTDALRAFPLRMLS